MIRAEIESWGKVDPGGVVQVVRVKCPFCPQVHTHGFPVTRIPTIKIERPARCNRGTYEIRAEADSITLSLPHDRGPFAA